MKGIEPIRLSASDPKSDSATYYDTSGDGRDAQIWTGDFQLIRLTL